MEQIVEKYLEKALVEYSKDNYYQTLLSAKTVYFSMTGQIDEEDEDYELRMNAFNDWYILQYQPESRQTPLIDEFLKKQGVEEEIRNIFKEVNFSLFEYLGTSFRKKYVFKDYLHNTKVYLSPEVKKMNFFKSDLFIGRFLNLGTDSHLLPGMCFLPKEVKSILKKQVRKVKKQKDQKKEMDFLLKVESLKNKWLRFGHLPPSKVFIFEE